MNGPVGNRPVLRVAGPGDIRAINGVLVAAIRSAGVSRWLYPDAGTRYDRCQEHISALTLAALEHGSAYVVEDDSRIVAAALWKPCGHRAPQRPTTVAVPPAASSRPDRVELLDASLAAWHPVEPHQHLLIAGVHPERQRTGIGTELVRRTPDSTVASPAYQQILAVFTATDNPLRAKDICHALGTGTTAKDTERLRAKLKRLVARDVLTELEPCLFAVPATSSPDPTPES